MEDIRKTHIKLLEMKNTLDGIIAEQTSLKKISELKTAIETIQRETHRERKWGGGGQRQEQNISEPQVNFRVASYTM